MARSKNKSFGERSLTSRLPIYDQGLLKNAISYLFTNFPHNWMPKRLWYIFATYRVRLGRIVDVFVLKKKDKKGNSFGFVRFAEVKDKGRLEHFSKSSTLVKKNLGLLKQREKTLVAHSNPTSSSPSSSTP